MNKHHPVSSSPMSGKGKAPVPSLAGGIKSPKISPPKSSGAGIAIKAGSAVHNPSGMAIKPGKV